MSINVLPRKLLWGKSGMRCAFPDRGQALTVENDFGAETVVGIECHIVAQKDSQTVARSESLLMDEERADYAHLIDNRDSYENLVLMCGVHSTQIDDPAQGISVATILEMKAAHERAVAESGAAPTVPPPDLFYAEIIDQWAQRIVLDRWPLIIQAVFADGHPRMEQDQFDALAETSEWIFNRVWPGVRPEIEEAMENFRRVANDLLWVLSAYPHEHLRTRGLVAPLRFYNDHQWLEQVGRKRTGELYDYLSFLIEDYATELTRAGNLVCHAVREGLDPRFRRDEGLLTLQSGPYEDLRFRLHRPTYAQAGDSWHPYEGRRDFPEARANRDTYRDDRPVPPELERLLG